MMPKMILALLLCAFSTHIFAQKLGVGAMVGNPTGLNVKKWLNEKSAVDGGLGFTLGKNSRFNLHSDYLFHQKEAFFFNDVHPLDLYYGLGGRMKFADDIYLGVRLPVGLAYEVENAAADTFVELAPVVDFIGRTGVDLQLLIGARYYF